MNKVTYIIVNVLVILGLGMAQSLYESREDFIVLLKQAARNDAVSKLCAQDLEFFASSLISGENEWANRMADARGKVCDDIIESPKIFIGDYDVCVNIRSDTDSRVNGTHSTGFTGRYCKVTIDANNVPITEAYCLPSSCHKQDVFLMKNKTDTVVHSFCDGEKPWFKDGAAVATVVVLCLILLITLASTLYHAILLHSQDSTEDSVKLLETKGMSFDIFDEKPTEQTPTKNYGALSQQMQNQKLNRTSTKILVSFSLLQNCSRLATFVQPPDTYKSVVGIRFFAFMGIALFLQKRRLLDKDEDFPLIVNPKNIHHVESSFLGYILINGYLSVNTFFLINGFLVTSAILKQLDRLDGGLLPFLKNIPYYLLHRYIRLTPVYALIIMIAGCLVWFMASGPLWPEENFTGFYLCKSLWWQNLLYINNLPNTELCLPETWYLSADFQFYILAPIFVYLLHRNSCCGGIFLFLIMAVCFIVKCLYYTHIIPSDNFIAEVYNKPYMWFNNYGYGIALGYLTYRTKCKLSIAKPLVIVFWLVSIVFVAAALFGDYPYDPLGPNLIKDDEPRYAAAMSTQGDIFSMGVAWMIFACLHGYGGWINSILSWKFWIPLSRVSYVGYIIHYVVIVYTVHLQRQLIYYQYSTIVLYFGTNLLIIVSISAVLTLTVVLPFKELDQILLPHDS